ncbi:MAG: ATP-binding protein, partial [Ilumatobacteraceae bacterium]
VEQRLSGEEGRTPAAELLDLRALLQGAALPARAEVAVEVDPAFTGAPTTLPFLGRAVELETVESFIARTLDEGGASGSTMVCGPAGTGRTRFLAEVVDRAAGARNVHAIQCSETDRDHPMLTVGRLMRAIAKDAKLRKQPVIDEGVTAMFGRFAEMLDGLGPTLLVVDDLHLADTASIAVLRSLVCPGGAAQLCLVVSSPTALEGHADGPAVVLGALSADDMRPLGIDTAWRETGGHPGLLAACCAAGTGSGVLRGDALGSVRAPLDDLGPLAPVVLTAASTLNSWFTAAQVGLAAGLGLEAVSGLLRSATGKGVLRALGDDRFEFSAQVQRRLLAAEVAPSPRA